uniref:5'-methylthioadenosine/S-adenosylhomocysteine nucleosidase n=1 Tax=Aegilops tauschii TaxID=37682 RepID=M8AKH2_AEGTA
MQAEMLPLVHRFQLLEVPTGESIFPKGAPWARYCGNYKGLHIDLVWPGKDPALGVDSVGTLSAALVTHASIQFLKPDLIINAGTASGFKAKGAGVGDVFLKSDVVFHDRRIPIPVGKLSTGDSRDMSPHDVLEILSNGATLKDMEGAAVAHVADMFSTPAIFVKAVTEIVDGEKPRAEEFLQNLTAATKALDQAVAEVIHVTLTAFLVHTVSGKYRQALHLSTISHAKLLSRDRHGSDGRVDAVRRAPGCGLIAGAQTRRGRLNGGQWRKLGYDIPQNQTQTRSDSNQTQ